MFNSYDVTALFISVPVDPALGIIKDLLEKGNALKERTVLPVKDIILLLEFCLKNTFFSFQSQFYEQLKGVAMGCPVSPIMANLYMEYFEQKVLSTATHPLECGSDMWIIHVLSTKEEHKQTFLEHINNVDLAIRFTVEDYKENGPIPFLDTIVKPEADGRLSITLFRKPATTDQSPQSHGHHHLSAMYSVINTLTHRAKTV